MSRRLRRYGLSAAQYEAMVEAQKGCCAICGEAKPLVIDHDHRTGAVRGLLCTACNIALGIVERREWLEQATAYLRCTRVPRDGRAPIIVL